MKAVLSERAGKPEDLGVGTLPDPAPKAGQVVVAVRACGVNYFDFLLVQDQHHTRPPRPYSPGGEAAGIVEAVGEGVSSVAVGDRVMVGSMPFGGMVEKLAIEAHFCIPIPDSMSFEVAASFPLTYGTSYYALKDRGHLKAGQTVLVLGAAGGAGLAAVELGKAMGARVIAAVSTPEKLAIAREHGADDGIVYPRGPFDKAGAKALADEFKRVCGPGGANIVYDPVGGEYSEAALRALAWEGSLLVVGFPAGIPKIPLNLTLLKSVQIVGVFWGPWVWRDPEASLANMREVAAFYEAGKLRPLVSERFPFRRAGEAIAWVGARRALGKVVVTLDETADAASHAA